MGTFDWMMSESELPSQAMLQYYYYQMQVRWRFHLGYIQDETCSDFLLLYLMVTQTQKENKM